MGLDELVNDYKKSIEKYKETPEKKIQKKILAAEIEIDEIFIENSKNLIYYFNKIGGTYNTDERIYNAFLYSLEIYQEFIKLKREREEYF